jgi:hypothetical protein
MEYVLSGREEMSEQNYCYQCCLFDICKHIDRGTHTLASPACDAFDPGMRWIPVTERLPDEDRIVLGYFPAKKGTSSEIQATRGWCVPILATHWMPLPDAPEK